MSMLSGPLSEAINFLSSSSFLQTEASNYALVTETRALYNGTIANEIVDITGLIPYSAYAIQVRAYNTEGSILSNQRTVTMPTGSKSCH